MTQEKATVFSKQILPQIFPYLLVFVQQLYSQPTNYNIFTAMISLKLFNSFVVIPFLEVQKSELKNILIYEVFQPIQSMK